MEKTINVTVTFDDTTRFNSFTDELLQLVNKYKPVVVEPVKETKKANEDYTAKEIGKKVTEFITRGISERAHFDIGYLISDCCYNCGLGRVSSYEIMDLVKQKEYKRIGKKIAHYIDNETIDKRKFLSFFDDLIKLVVLDDIDQGTCSACDGECCNKSCNTTAFDTATETVNPRRSNVKYPKTKVCCARCGKIVEVTEECPGCGFYNY